VACAGFALRLQRSRSSRRVRSLYEAPWPAPELHWGLMIAYKLPGLARSPIKWDAACSGLALRFILIYVSNAAIARTALRFIDCKKSGTGWLLRLLREASRPVVVWHGDIVITKKVARAGVAQRWQRWSCATLATRPQPQLRQYSNTSIPKKPTVQRGERRPSGM
jgi:hypothetical protein